MDEARASSIARFLLLFILIVQENPITHRSLSAILADLSTTIQALTDQRIPPLLLDQELAMRDQALQSGIEAQAFRVLEILVLTAHASGLTKHPALQQAPAYVEAVQVLRMSGRHLPTDL